MAYAAGAGDARGLPVATIAAAHAPARGAADPEPEPTATESTAERRARKRRERLARLEEQQQTETGGPMLALAGPAFFEYNFTAPRSLLQRAHGQAPGAGPAPADPQACASGGSGGGDDDGLAAYQKRFLVAGSPLYIASFAETLLGATHEVQTASSVWSCAIVLAKYLEALSARQHATGLAAAARPLLTRSTRVLELGSGTGLAGVAAARVIGALPLTPTPMDAGEVVITDVADVVRSLGQTIAINRRVAPITYPLRAAALDWLHADRDLQALHAQAAQETAATVAFDVVLAADVVWVEHLIPPFVAALEKCTVASTEILFCFQSRSLRGEQHLFGLLAKSFTWTRLPEDEYDPEFVDPKIAIYRIRRKKAV